MNTAEALKLHSHRLGSFAKTILEDEELAALLQDSLYHVIVLVPTERGIKALDDASMHTHTHDPKDYVVCLSADHDPIGLTVWAVSNRQLEFSKDGFDTKCNSVLMKNDAVEGPITTPNGKIFVLDRPLQFYE